MSSTLVELIGALIEPKHAYLAQRHVLFHVPSFPKYRQLPARRTQEMIATPKESDAFQP